MASSAATAAKLVPAVILSPLREGGKRMKESGALRHTSAVARASCRQNAPCHLAVSWSAGARTISESARTHRTRCANSSAALRSFEEEPLPPSDCRDLHDLGDMPADLRHVLHLLDATSAEEERALALTAGDPASVPPTSDFRWERQWYAVHALDHIDPAVPHGVTVIGRPMVLWRDTSDTWRCFLDECPHRRVPLSEGRIDEKGRLACSYHAWSFHPDGKCACIPQASEGPEARAVNNSRSSCVTFPLRVEHGLIFVWPDETTPHVAAQVSPSFPRELDSTLSWRTHVRDLPYSYEYLAENIVDPAHVPSAHHNVAGVRRSQVKPIPLRLTRFDQSGFEGFYPLEPSKFFNGKATTSVRHQYASPSLFYYDRTLETEEGKFRTVNAVYMTPTSPGNSRVIFFDGGPEKVSYFASMLKVLNILGLQHTVLLDLFDSDAVFLHYQEVAMRAKERRGDPSWRDQYYLPTRSDLYVINLRKWLESFGHGGVKYGPGWDLGSTPGGTPRELMDRHNGHVAHCKICSASLANYRRLLVVFWALGSACLLLTGGLLGSAMLARRAPAGTVAALLLLGALFGGGIMFCHMVIQRFTYMGWNHARNP